MCIRDSCIPVAAFGEGIADVTGLEIECAFDVSKIVPTGMIIKRDDLLDQNLFLSLIHI